MPEYEAGIRTEPPTGDWSVDSEAIPNERTVTAPAERTAVQREQSGFATCTTSRRMSVRMWVQRPPEYRVGALERKEGLDRSETKSQESSGAWLT